MLSAESTLWLWCEILGILSKLGRLAKLLDQGSLLVLSSFWRNQTTFWLAFKNSDFEIVLLDGRQRIYVSEDVE